MNIREVEQSCADACHDMEVEIADVRRQLHAEQEQVQHWKARWQDYGRAAQRAALAYEAEAAVMREALEAADDFTGHSVRCTGDRLHPEATCDCGLLELNEMVAAALSTSLAGRGRLVAEVVEAAQRECRCHTSVASGRCPCTLCKKVNALDAKEDGDGDDHRD